MLLKPALFSRALSADILLARCLRFHKVVAAASHNQISLDRDERSATYVVGDCGLRCVHCDARHRGSQFHTPRKETHPPTRAYPWHRAPTVQARIKHPIGPKYSNWKSNREFAQRSRTFPGDVGCHSHRHTVDYVRNLYLLVGRYWSRIRPRLAQRAQAGVHVHVLLDWVGSIKMDLALLTMMKDAGVAVERYHPLQWYHMARMNNRTHRKVLVVDGRVGFTGGVGIAEQWNGNAEAPDHWRDEHFRFEGPVVAQAQAVFMDNWIKVTGVVLRGDAYFPALTPVANSDAQMFSSSPTGGSESMALLYLMAITAAERSIDLSAAYFIPDRLTQPALVAALRRGVVVRIIVPGKYMDADSVRMASRAQGEPLLQAGALIYELGPTMFHCKIVIVDSLLVSVGSTNFDNRSFTLNDEASLNLIDPEFANKMTRVFEDDLRRSTLVTLEAWRSRPITEKLREAMVRPWSSQF